MATTGEEAFSIFCIYFLSCTKWFRYFGGITIINDTLLVSNSSLWDQTFTSVIIDYIKRLGEPCKKKKWLIHIMPNKTVKAHQRVKWMAEQFSLRACLLVWTGWNGDRILVIGIHGNNWLDRHILDIMPFNCIQFQAAVFHFGEHGNVEYLYEIILSPISNRS